MNCISNAHSLSLSSPCYIFAILILCVSYYPLLVRGTRSRRRFCNNFDPQCGIAPEKAFQTLLTSNDQLLPKLLAFKRRARFRIQIGPLIRNDDNEEGIIDIDQALSPTFPVVNTSVCGNDINPTIRESVICTVTNGAVQPPRGNVNASKIGYSTQGRPIYAIRMGNPRGIPVLVVSQQHGNEPASTEAVFKFLGVLQANPRLRVRLLRVLDIVIVVRANPDGGEPTATFNIPVAPFTGTEAFFRHNVDPAAGGGFIADTEPGFFGIVGRGYDLNRYHYVKLDGPIRPVETQALVAVQLAFQPRVTLDMHGDVQKCVCEIDRTSINPGSFLGALPSGKCELRADSVPSLTTQRNESIVGSFFATDRLISTGVSDGSETMVLGRPLTIGQLILRRAISSAVSTLQPIIIGILARFSQLSLGTASLEGASLGDFADDFGSIGTGWEVVNFVNAIRPAAVSVRIVNGIPVPEVSAESYIPEPCFLRDNICLHELFLRTSLFAIAGKGHTLSPFDTDFCDMPLASGLVASAPSVLGWGNLSNEDNVLIPLGTFPAAPSTITSSCPNDLGM
eukprot:TRINITY_DN63642_c0_g1_i1.p1 TRINITY_DN63642_c0_g1~~TRINITY_DN63642_c0_g1_i1.p1  ORF type:complete len:566 (-),score=48.82 TRINITY_DN63642_c0_g1_i1:254-1951(-)